VAEEAWVEIMNWLNSNSGAIGALSAVVLTIITAVYVYLTGRLAKESQAMRLAMLQPELAVYLCSAEGAPLFLLLRIENIGSGPAYRLRFSTDRPFQAENGVDLRELGIFRKGLNFLAPKQRIEHFLVSVIGKLDQLIKVPLKISIEYRDVLGKNHTRDFVLDFGEFENISTLGTPPLHEIASAAKKIQEYLHHLVTGTSKLQVLTESLSAHQHHLNAQSLARRLERLAPEQLEEIKQSIADKEKASASEDRKNGVTSGGRGA
jgi:hypothetical protein